MIRVISFQKDVLSKQHQLGDNKQKDTIKDIVKGLKSIHRKKQCLFSNKQKTFKAVHGQDILTIKKYESLSKFILKILDNSW